MKPTVLSFPGYRWLWIGGMFTFAGQWINMASMAAAEMNHYEVLRDALGHLFAADPTLQPHDVHVLCPDLERFAPLVQAVFDRGSLPIPVRVGDRSLTVDDPFAGALQALLALVAGRGVAVGLGGELGLLQLGIGGHAAIPISARQLEHAVVELVEPGERDELERVAHGAQLALELGDRGGVELLAPVERRRAVVRETLARELGMDRLGELLGLGQVGRARLAPHQVGVGRVGEAAVDGHGETRFANQAARRMLGEQAGVAGTRAAIDALPPQVLRRMELLFGTSFESVRVHIGPEPASLGTQAFVHGRI